MIAMLKKIYRNRQLTQTKKRYYENSIIGKMHNIGINASIYNESGNKNSIIIGNHCNIEGGIVCKKTGVIHIGNYSWLGERAQILCLESIKIGHYVGIGDNTLIVDNNGHPTDPLERVKHRIRVAPGGPGYPGFGDGSELSKSAPIIIEDVVWIGANCLICKGVVIGEGSIVARNSTVTKDVPPYTIVAGNPAKVVKQLDKPSSIYYTPDSVV